MQLPRALIPAGQQRAPWCSPQSSEGAFFALHPRSVHSACPGSFVTETRARAAPGTAGWEDTPSARLTRHLSQGDPSPSPGRQQSTGPFLQPGDGAERHEQSRGTAQHSTSLPPRLVQAGTPFAAAVWVGAGRFLAAVPHGGRSVTRALLCCSHPGHQ